MHIVGTCVHAVVVGRATQLLNLSLLLSDLLRFLPLDIDLQAILSCFAMLDHFVSCSFFWENREN